MSEMVERVARRLRPVAWASLDRDGEKAEDQHKRAAEQSLIHAREAIIAMRDPTADMVEEGCDTLNNEVSWRGKEAECAYPCHLRPVYASMIDAALAEQPKPQS